jgi:hypothetical protein
MWEVPVRFFQAGGEARCDGCPHGGQPVVFDEPAYRSCVLESVRHLGAVDPPARHHAAEAEGGGVELLVAPAISGKAFNLTALSIKRRIRIRSLAFPVRPARCRPPRLRVRPLNLAGQLLQPLRNDREAIAVGMGKRRLSIKRAPLLTVRAPRTRNHDIAAGTFDIDPRGQSGPDWTPDRDGRLSKIEMQPAFGLVGKCLALAARRQAINQGADLVGLGWRCPFGLLDHENILLDLGRSSFGVRAPVRAPRAGSRNSLLRLPERQDGRRRRGSHSWRAVRYVVARPHGGVRFTEEVGARRLNIAAIAAICTGRFAVDPGDRVMTLGEWRTLRRISASTERRMRAAGSGPTLTHISDHLLGVTVRDDRAWLAARSEKVRG